MPRAPLFRRTRSLLALSVSALTLAAGCGMLSWEGSQSAPVMPGPLKRAKVTVGVLPIVDAAAVHMAIKKGYFKAEGLEVELKNLAGGAAAIPGMANGELQFAFGNYVSFFAAQSKKVLDITLIADGYQARPHVFMIVAARGSGIARPQDLAGKKIAINTKNNIVELTTRATLEAAGVDMKTVTFVEVPFPDMRTGLERKNFDAAFMVEPFITQAERLAGVTAVADPASGPTNEIPIAGWAASAKFTKENPRTVAAFQRAIVKGQRDCANRTDVEDLVTAYANVERQTASLLHLGTWPLTLEPARLQRVADLMKTYGVLTGPLDVKAMIYTAPSS
ncbi:thiamine biosynthesis protein [Kibdelosporangium aridum]|uniref:Thiamine biosynthesis protein n=1 Tax=Kibdelosporangium aridum TaxID=2030 RepID=A0A428ZNP6_KIBAR|nr:ABC transporter substrate-binding protein [Kibdelosporangium aridum]RSM89667.1 thiamine biosynthesis protein [Kibdelosporangium aridum]